MIRGSEQQVQGLGFGLAPRTDASRDATGNWTDELKIRPGELADVR